MLSWILDFCCTKFKGILYFLKLNCIINNIHNTTKVKFFCDVFEDVSYAYQFEHKNLFDQKYI